MIEVPQPPPMGTHARVEYCEETLEMAYELNSHILIHPIKWWRLQRIVHQRNKLLKASR